ncbi:DUF3631 domain-containing protein [Moraxella catarrhalis]|nr:DUF3631 domain-containing protein [Moraxella catarrhalis]
MMGASMTKTNLFINSLPAYTGDITHDDLRCVDFTHVVDVDGVNDIQGQTAGIKLFGADAKPKSVLIYPNGRKPYPYPHIKGVAVLLGDIKQPIHAVLGLDNAQALFDALQATPQGGAVITLPDNMDGLFKAVLDAFKPICVYTTHDKYIEYKHGDVISYSAPLSVALANETLTDMMASDDITITGNALDLDTQIQQLQQQIKELSQLDEMRLHLQAPKVAKSHAIGKDKLLQWVYEYKQGDFIADIVPYADSVTNDEIYQALYELIDRHIIIDEPLKVAFVLWVLFTYLIDDCDIAPIAWITAPEKSCGKSTLLGLFERVVNRPYTMTDPSQAVLYRIMDKYKPCLLIDEIDTGLKDKSTILGILNAGYSRHACKIPKVNMDKGGTVESFNAFGAKVLCGIGGLTGTTASRSIKFELKRKSNNDKVARLNKRTLTHAKTDLIRQKAKRWATDNRQAIIQTEIELLPINDRVYDNWYILLQIAHVLGVYDTAKQACLTINKAKDELSTNEQLLFDIREVWRGEKMALKFLLERLIADDEKAWASLNNGQEMTAHQLGKRLRGFGIAPKTIKTGVSTTAKGYDKDQFTQIWERYLSPKVDEFLF